MTAAWPSWISATALIAGYGEELEVNLASFQPDIGPAKRRRRTSMSNDLVDFQQNYTGDEYDDLKYFFRVTLSDGALPFTFTHPRTGQLAIWQFGSPLKMVERFTPDDYRVQFSLRLLDMTQLYRLIDYDYATLVDSDGAKLITA